MLNVCDKKIYSHLKSFRNCGCSNGFRNKETTLRCHYSNSLLFPQQQMTTESAKCLWNLSQFWKTRSVIANNRADLFSETPHSAEINSNILEFVRKFFSTFDHLANHNLLDQIRSFSNLTRRI